jgi:uncharacterized phage-associated protein
MYSAITIANYFVQKALMDNADMTPIKLVKMTYLAHGWYLAITGGKPLMSEPVLAWRYGPIVQSVYHAFKKYGREQVTSLEFDFGNRVMTVEDRRTKEILNRVWDIYKDFTGPQLSALTHKSGTPWDKVRHLHEGKSLVISIIPNELIFSFYSARVKNTPPASGKFQKELQRSQPRRAKHH